MPDNALTILHLSDPQFGKNHVFGKRALPIADGKHDTLLARTLEDLELLKKEWDLVPDLIVMTGDVAEWGEEDEFKLGFEFLAGVAQSLGIEPEQRHRIAIIPGNHDINRSLAEAEFALWRGRGKKGEPFGFLRWEHYAAAFNEFYKDVPDTPVDVPGLAEKVSLRPAFTIEAPHSIFIVPEFKTVLAGLNSTLAECHLDATNAKTLLGTGTIYGHHGWCGEDQYKHFAAKLSPFEAAGWLRVGLVHHNFVRGDMEDEENLRDAAHLRDRLGNRLNLLLHGHTHVADRASLPHGQPVFSTGSGALSQAQRPNETPNQYQVLRLSSDGVVAWMRAYDHHSRRWFPDGRGGGERSPGRLWVPHAFQKASAALGNSKHRAVDVAQGPDKASRDSEPTVRSDHETKAGIIEDGLVSSFIGIAKHRWIGCATEWHGTEPPFLSVVTDEEYGHRSFPVGLLRLPFALDDVARFDHQTSAFSWERWLVCEHTKLTEQSVWVEIKEYAAKRGIRLLSWRDYERMSDLRIAIEQQKNELRASKEYPPDLYISQGMEFFPEPKPGQAMDEVQPLPPVEDGFAELTSRIEKEGPNFFLIDGDFGAGKTFLLHQLALHYSQDGERVIPLLIELRSLDKVQNATDMLITRLSRLGQEQIKPTQLAYMAEAGHLLILFDGYDELALRVSFDRAADHLSTITEAARGKATVVLTCRTQHFKDDHQMVVRLLEQPGLCRARLCPFDESQIRGFLEKKLGDTKAAERRFALIHDIKDLLGLSENPRMLSFIADLPEQDLTEAQKASPDGKITASRLYETIIERWLRNEVRRHSHLQIKDAVSGHSKSPTSKSDARYLQELWHAVTRLAFEAWGRMERPFELKEIQDTLKKLPESLMDTTLNEDERTHGIASGSLLSREGSGTFAFAHYSIPEFLVAKDLARQLCPKDDHPCVLPATESKTCFSREAITDLMAEFLVDEMGWHAALEFGLAMSASPDDGAHGPFDRRNAARLLNVCRKRAEQSDDQDMRRALEERQRQQNPARHAGEDLRGQNLAERNLQYADFSNADLSQTTLRKSNLRHTSFIGARLAEANLRRTDLRGAYLADCDLRGADLSYADLSGADLRLANLTRATLIGADLRGAVTTGSVWDMARLAGAAVDDPQMVSLEAFGAGLPLLAHTPALLPGASGVKCVAWSPKQDVVATGHDNGCITLWDAASGKCEKTLEGHTGMVWSVAFSPDGSRLASGSDDKTLRLWDAASGKSQNTLEGHSGRVMSVAFSPDGSRLASGSDDNTLRLWDAHSGKCQDTLEGHTGRVWSVAFSPDGSRLASGSNDKTLRLWDAHSGKCQKTLEGHSGRVLSVAFSPDGSRLASGSYDKTLRLWDAHTGKCQNTLEGHSGWVWSVAFSPDGSRLASGSNDKTLRLWDAHSGKCQNTLEGHSGRVWSVAFSPDGSRLASGSDDKTLRLWDAHSGKCQKTLEGHSGRVLSVAFSPDGSRLASGSNDKTLRLWDAHSGKCQKTLEGHSGRVLSVAFSPDGSRLASGSNDKTLRLWDAHTGKCQNTLEGHTDWVWSVAFSPDGSRLASGSDDKTLRLWDAASGKCQNTLEGHSDWVWSVAFSPDGSRLASGSDDNTLRLWDAHSGKCQKTLKGHTGRVLSVVFSPDGSRLASGSDDNTLRLWDAHSGKCQKTLKGHSNVVMSVAFSPDGSRLASGSDDNTLRLWDAHSGKCQNTLEGHTGRVLSVTFWQGRMSGPLLLVSASADGTIRLWDADEGTCLGILLAHGDGYAALRPDGRYRMVGNMRDYLWHVSGLVRYELGELDEVDPQLKLAENEPLIPPHYFAKA